VTVALRLPGGIETLNVPVVSERFPMPLVIHRRVFFGTERDMYYLWLFGAEVPLNCPVEVW
jgi:hypothetical protein